MERIDIETAGKILSTYKIVDKPDTPYKGIEIKEIEEVDNEGYYLRWENGDRYRKIHLKALSLLGKLKAIEFIKSGQYQEAVNSNLVINLNLSQSKHLVEGMFGVLILRKVWLKTGEEDLRPIKFSVQAPVLAKADFDFSEFKKVELSDFEILDTAQIQKYFYEFAFSKELNNAVNMAFKDLEVLKTIYLFDSFKLIVTDLFSSYLLNNKFIKSNKDYNGNGITEFVHNETNIKLEEKLYNLPNDFKLIRLRFVDFQENQLLVSVYCIMFFIHNVAKEIDHYVIVNDKLMNKKVLRKVFNNGNSSAIKFIKNTDFILKEIIDEIVFENNDNEMPF